MIKKIICAFIAFSFLTALYASDQDLLAIVDSLVSYMDTDFQAEYVIVQDKPGTARSTTVAGIFRRDSREQYVIVVMEPAISRGQGYLREKNTLWFYDPESRKFNSTSASGRFQNTNARNSDFTRSTLAKDYKVTAGEDIQLGRFKCRLLSLEAVTNEVTYSKMKIWISEDNLLRKAEDYSLSGQLLRTTLIPDYYSLNGRFVPRQILFVDELAGSMVNGAFVKERTQININKPSFNKIADSVFSQTFLENINR